MPDDAPAPDDAPSAAPFDFEEQVRLAEALIFAATAPTSPRQLTALLDKACDVEAVIAALRARYAGRGVELASIAAGWQFRTAPDLAPKLRRVVQVPRRLPRVAMETLAIIAYHQPITRTEIEEIRGAALGQTTLDSLLEADLVTPKGRKESPGRPTLWGTTPQFLAQFGLNDLRELPPRGDLLVEPMAVHRPQQPAAEPAPDAAATDEFPPDPVSC